MVRPQPLLRRADIVLKRHSTSIPFDASKPEPVDFALACIRIPKSGSSTLAQELDLCPTFGQRHRLFTTLDPDARISTFQQLRLARSRLKALLRGKYGLSRSSAFRLINNRIRNGDLITGGHFDVPTVLHNIRHRMKFVTLLRNPALRCMSEYNYARAAYQGKHPLMRFDSGLRAKMAARYSFDGYVDFLLEHREVYGNMSAQFLGLHSRADIPIFERKHVFHWGTLEGHSHFRRQLHTKLGMNFVPDGIHRNRTGRKSVETLSLAQLCRLHDLHALDFEIWEHVHQCEQTFR